MLRSFEDVDNLLRSYIPAAGHFKDKYTLDNMRAIMAALGNPQNAYKVVHVAGTSGKTSTAYFLASLLHAGGAKVGLTVSPHIDHVNERVQINLLPLAEEQFCRELDEFLGLINKLRIKPSYFELLVAFAFWEFARQGVDYAVVEVGLGGLLDGTNLVTRTDKVCVITDIGMDHTAVLGGTIEAIAEQKAGIIHANNQVFCLQQSQPVVDVFVNEAHRQNAQLYICKEAPEHGAQNLPLFQRRNWSLAVQVWRFMKQRDKLTALSPEQLAKAARVHIPARMEKVQVGGQTLYLDGSHNAQKVTALVRSLKESLDGKTVAVLLGMVEDKDASAPEVMAQLHTLTDSIIITEFAGAQDMPKVSLPIDHLADLAKAEGFTTIIAEKDAEKALTTLLTQQTDVYLVTGSFYLLNHIRPIVLNKNHD